LFPAFSKSIRVCALKLLSSAILAKAQPALHFKYNSIAHRLPSNALSIRIFCISQVVSTRD
jgi:hypothetical protein